MIFEQLDQQLRSLSEVINKLSDQQYTHQVSYLGNASIGGHTRHIIELLLCATNGYEQAKVDYVKRKRDMALETDRLLALQTIQFLSIAINKSDKGMMLVGDDDFSCGVMSTYYREIVYNTEHTIHHLALIKVALLELNLKIVDENFGMAYSTIKHRAALAEGLKTN